MITTTSKELAEVEETLRNVRAGILESATKTLEQGFEKCATMRAMIWRSELSTGFGSNHQAEKREILRSVRHCETVIGFQNDGNFNQALSFMSALETMANTFSGSPELKDYGPQISRAAEEFKRKYVDTLWPRELNEILTKTEERLRVELQKMEASSEAMAA